MKIRLFSFLVFSGLFLCGCAVEDTPIGPGVVKAVMESDQTRTSVTDEGTFTWSSGDQIWLQTTAGHVIGTLSSGAGTPQANFSYGPHLGDRTGKALCPYHPGHTITDNVADVMLPSTYDLGTNISNTNAVLYGETSGGVLEFRHLAGVMRFVFKDVPKGTDRFELTLDKKINGTFKTDLSAQVPVIETEPTAVASEKTITLTFDPLPKTSDICLYVPLPVGTYTAIGMSLYKGNDTLWTYSNNVTNTISRKTLKLMPSVSMGGNTEPAGKLLYSEDNVIFEYGVAMARVIGDVYKGKYDIYDIDLADFFDVEGDFEGHDARIDFEITDWYVANNVDLTGNSYSLSADDKVRLAWGNYSDLEVPIRATLKINGIEYGSLDLLIYTENPLTFTCWNTEVLRNTRYDTQVNLYRLLEITSIARGETRTNLVDTSKQTFAEAFEYIYDTYRGNVEITLLRIYCLDQYGQKTMIDSSKYNYENAVLTIFADDAATVCYAEFMVNFSSVFSQGYESMNLKVTIR